MLKKLFVIVVVIAFLYYTGEIVVEFGQLAGSCQHLSCLTDASDTIVTFIKTLVNWMVA